jgi:hypothetical protein
MKRALISQALLVGTALVYLVWNHADYGGTLPPGLPADIAVIDGEVISGRRTLFEDGRGYVIDMQTDRPYAEVVRFYADRYGDNRLTAAPGMGAEFATADLGVDGAKVFLEIHSRATTTHVTMAIHLGRWW